MILTTYAIDIIPVEHDLVENPKDSEEGLDMLCALLDTCLANFFRILTLNCP